MNKRRSRVKRSNILQFEQSHDFYFKLAVRRAMDKHYTAALRYVDMAIGMDAYNAEYLFNKACILVELRRTRESIKILNYIIWNIDPTFAECYFGLGCNYFEIGSFDKSLHSFEKYLLMENDGEFFEDAYEILYYMRLPGELQNFDLENHIESGENMQRKFMDSSMKLHAAGTMYLLRGNYKEAIRQFERSIMAYPEIKSSRIRLSMAYYMTGQIAPAKLLASSVLKIQKNNQMAKLCLALYYFTDGQNDLSERILGMFARSRSKKAPNAQDGEDHEFYRQMLSIAPVGDELKSRLTGVMQKLYSPG